MKPINRYLKNIFFGLSLFAFLLLSFSCSDDDTNDPPDEEVDPELTVLVTGAALNAANGLDIGADGNLYIGSVNGQEIVVMDQVSGNIINRLREGVQSPDDVVFGPDGSLYWTDILTGEVGRRTPEGTVTKQAFLPGVNPIAFNEEGRLFVALDFLGDGLYEFDPNLEEPPRPIIQASEANPFPLGFFNAFDFGSDGRLYGPLFAANLVIAVDVGGPDDPPYTGTFMELVEAGTIEILAGISGEFNNPASAKFGPDGLLYILDQTGKLFTLDTGTGILTVVTDNLGAGLDNMVFDQDGSLFMTNNDEGWVAEILLPGGQARILSPGGMIVPQGIAVLAGSNNEDAVFISDLFSVREFNGSTGQQESQYKGFLVPVPGEVTLTLSQNVSASGSDLVISSFFSSTVQIWNPENGVLEDFAEQVAAPIDAVRLNTGEVIVSDLGLGGVVRMSDNSQIVPLGVASGMATDGESVWAADWATGDIVQINFEGGAPVTSVFNLGLEGPEGIALDLDGNLLVYETGAGRLTRIDDFATGDRTILIEGLEPKAGGLPGFPPMWFFDGIDVGPSGDIYIRGGGENVIYKILNN